MEHYLWLLALGFPLGALGTLIGAGGGFILAPVLLLLYPNNAPETITSISLAVVFFNALSGSYAYGRLARIDYKSGLLLAAAAVPGAIMGALGTKGIPRRTFDVVFGIVMMAAAIYTVIHRSTQRPLVDSQSKYQWTRSVIEKNGTTHVFSFDTRLGIGLSMFVGYVSSLLGIGGGIIHVPVLVRLLNFPVHIATATSHFILAIMALAGTVVHVVTGSFSQGGIHRAIILSVGVVFGAQVGAWLSAKVRGTWIIRALAAALVLVGIRIVLMGLEML